jgi:hypothetical protein
LRKIDRFIIMLCSTNEEKNSYFGIHENNFLNRFTNVYFENLLDLFEKKFDDHNNKKESLYFINQEICNFLRKIIIYYQIIKFKSSVYMVAQKINFVSRKKFDRLIYKASNFQKIKRERLYVKKPICKHT